MIRTCDPLIRSQILYPAELRVHEGRKLLLIYRFGTEPATPTQPASGPRPERNAILKSTMGAPEPLLRCEDLQKIYLSGGRELPIFSGFNLQVFAGERVAIVG